MMVEDNSMQHTTYSGADDLSYGQEISLGLWNLMVCSVLKETATGSYPEPVETNLHSHLLNSISNQHT
jgi:hypothetical protein